MENQLYITTNITCTVFTWRFHNNGVPLKETYFQVLFVTVRGKIWSQSWCLFVELFLKRKGVEEIPHRSFAWIDREGNVSVERKPREAKCRESRTTKPRVILVVFFAAVSRIKSRNWRNLSHSGEAMSGYKSCSGGSQISKIHLAYETKSASKDRENPTSVASVTCHGEFSDRARAKKTRRNKTSGICAALARRRKTAGNFTDWASPCRFWLSHTKSMTRLGKILQREKERFSPVGIEVKIAFENQSRLDRLKGGFVSLRVCMHCNPITSTAVHLRSFPINELSYAASLHRPMR